jgi:membrane-bound serine protease (ClpP class)
MEATMEILLNPNIAYLILAFALMVTILALLSPGTGVLEIGALLVWALVAWQVFNLNFNWWALVALVVGLGLFVLAIRWPKKKAYLILSIALLVLGSAFLFPSDLWYQPAVNPVLALLVSILLASFFWVTAHKILEARNAPVRLDLNLVIDEIGEAKTDIHDEGTVLLGSELWSAHSAGFIPRGARVKVVSREGFILDVVAVQPTEGTEDNQ